MLVKRSGEMSVKQLVFKQYFSHDSTDELKIIKMFRVDVTERTGLIGIPVRGGNEEGIVWIEDFLAELVEPFSGQSSHVDSFFSVEFDLNLLL